MKTKLTKEIIDDVAKKLKVGSYAKVVIASIGIHEATYYRWLERGNKALKLKMLGKKIPETEKIFCEFCESIRQSEAEGEVVLTTMIFSKANDDWKAAMELLARKYPDRWARKDSVNLSGNVDTGPNQREESLNEFEEMFKDVPRNKLSEIISETTRKLYDARNGHNNGKTEKAK